MRIAIDVQSLYDAAPSGIGQALRETLRHLPSVPDTTYVLFSVGWHPATLPTSVTQRPDVQIVHRAWPCRVLNPLRALGVVSLERLLGQYVDVVWYPNTGYLCRTRARVVLTVHDLSWMILPDTFTFLQRQRYRWTRARSWIRRAHQVLTPSLTTKEDVIDLFGKPAESVHVVAHGVDHERFSHRPLPQDATRRQQLGVQAPYVLVLATQEPRKNIESVLEAFATIKTHGFAHHLVLAGGRGWKYRRFRRAWQRHPFFATIINLGYVSDDDKPALLRGADALCLPSRYEGFGMQVLEAMSCGTPAVVGRGSSLLEVGGTSVLPVRAVDPYALSETLEALLRDPTLQADLRREGPIQAQTFSWSEAAQETVLHLIQPT